MIINDRIAVVAAGKMSFSMTHPADCNAYLVKAAHSYILIDCGVGLANDAILEKIRSVTPLPVSHILITHHHADHIGGLRELGEKLHARVIVPALEAASILHGDEEMTGLVVARNAGYYPADYHLSPCRIDETVAAGDVLTIDGEQIDVLSGAGHSLGGVCYFFREGGMLFSGDLLMHGGKINLQNIPGADLRKYSDSVQALELLDVQQFYPGHGLFSLTDGKEHVRMAAAAFRSLGVPPNFV